MTMLPIFIIGMLVGGLLVYAWCNLKMNTPSALQAEYKGKFRTYVAETLVPDYENGKKTFGFKNPFVLSDGE